MDSDQKPAGLALLQGQPSPYRLGQTVHDVFLGVARLYPNEPALAARERTITYGELASAAYRASAELARAGVRPGDVIPILMPRGPDLVAILLGVLMRGAAYAVLDMQWPAARRRELITAVSAEIVVGSEEGTAGWVPPPDLFEVPTAEVDSVVVGGGDACCVFFTSGSTGIPKPVLSPHRATVRLFEEGAIGGSLGPGTRMPQWAPLPWDGLTLELWSMLLTGGTSVLGDEELPTNDQLRRMGIEGVNSTWLTSSLFNLLVDEDIDAFAGLRQVWTGGERLSPRHVRRFLQRHPEIALINGYGPAESCVFATTHPVEPADFAYVDGIPLGRPVAGTTVVILDGDRICAPGDVGEICIGGDGLALRYVGDPALTAQRFIELAVNGAAMRLYRTGDRGRIGPEGLLHFIGRADRLVKLRGVRVELGEVEAHLRAAPGVATGLVLPDLDDAGTCVGLIGYYVPGDGSKPDPRAVHRHLAASVPRQFIPDRLIPVPRIPVNANGKSDHAALRAMAPVSIAVQDFRPDGVAEDDPVLEEVVAVASAVVSSPLSAAGRLDDGGMTSLAALRLCMRLNERFGVRMGPQDVLEAASLRRLADLVRSARLPGGSVPASPSRATIPLVDTQVGFIVEYEVRPDSKAAHCLLSWVVQGPFDLVAFRQALDDVQRRHEALTARYEGDLEPVLMTGPPRPVEFTDLGHFVDLDSAWRAALPDLLRPLRIDAGDVWRSNWARTAPDTYLVALAIHHIAFDGWSESLLARDLSDAYAARLYRRAPIPTTADLANALADRGAEARRASRNDAARSYWIDLLADLPEHRDLRAVDQTGTVFALRRPLPVEWPTAVDTLARRLGTTRFPVLVATFATALGEVLGQEDFGIGVPFSVRQYASQSDSITCLIDTACLRLRPTADEPLSNVALRAHEQMSLARGRYALPFMEVVRAVNPARQHGRNPFFRTMFVLQDNDPPELTLEPATVRLRRPAVPEPMCEILVEVWPGAGGGHLDATFYLETAPSERISELLDEFERRLALAAASA
jgi:amino acid adenylation domain-containing protein